MKNPNERVLEELRKIFAENADKRICVVGTPCVGKTTLVKSLPNCLDQDEVAFTLLGEEAGSCVHEYVKHNPEEWKNHVIKFIKEYKIERGHPIFGTGIFDCDLVVYLEINEETLRERAAKRNADFQWALDTKKLYIDPEIKSSNIPVITIDVSSLVD